MCVKFIFRNLNSDLYPLYPTNTYTYKVSDHHAIDMQ